MRSHKHLPRLSGKEIVDRGQDRRYWKHRRLKDRERTQGARFANGAQSPSGPATREQFTPVRTCRDAPGFFRTAHPPLNY